MTEREKMLAGLPYLSRDPELLNIYNKAKSLLNQYNSNQSDDPSQRRNILNELFGKIGESVWIESPFYCDYGENIFLGSNIFIHTDCVFLDSNLISIGDNTLIAPKVQIYTANHPLKASERIIQTESGNTYVTTSKPVSIGANCWIGGNVVIVPGVSIGDNTTIAAGSLVTKDIPSNVLAMGYPCKVVKNL